MMDLENNNNCSKVTRVSANCKDVYFSNLLEISEFLEIQKKISVTSEHK